MTNIVVLSKDRLEVDSKIYRCVIGELGFTDTPLEGDKKTPLGEYALRECWYRADRVAEPQTQLPLKVIEKNDGWCDDPKHASYNLHVKLPFEASHETLWREDHAYDVIVPIGFNDENIVPGKGSAIFLHLAKPGFPPTLGCVAITLEDMLEILEKITKESRIIINSY